LSVFPPFALNRPGSLSDALSLLTFDDVPLGGGPELLLAMRMRILRPDSLVDLKRIPELLTVTLDEGEVVIGGAVTHQAASTSAVVHQHLPLLPEVLDQVGNPRVRASGTLAGNLVFAEPKSDVIPILMSMDAKIVLTSSEATRSLTIDEFILGPYYSAREPDELLTAIRIPVGLIANGVYEKYQTMERPTVGVAVLDLKTTSSDIAPSVRRVVVGAVGERPYLADFAPSDSIDGHEVAAHIEPIPDIAGSARYKRHVTGVTVNRAVAKLNGLVHP